MTLPSDPIILLSLINTRLRDQYPTLEELCKSEDIDPDDLVARLASIGYIYNPALNKFV